MALILDWEFSTQLKKATYLSESNNEHENEMIPLRMINEFVYCHRLFYLEYVNGEFEDSTDTIEGRYKHRRVDDIKGIFPSSDELDSDNDYKIHATSVFLSSEIDGIIAKIDLVEGEGKEVYPVEYKKGKPMKPSNTIWESDKIQLVCQSMILKQNGYECDKGIIYYTSTNQKILYNISVEDIKWAKDQIKNAKTLSVSKIVPSPLIESPKCVRCSLVSICLPDEISFLENVINQEKDEEIRRLYPARNDLYPLYVEEQGAFITKKGDEIIVKKDENVIGTSRLFELSSVSIFGNIQITTQTIKELCNRNISICYFSVGGWFNGITHGLSHKNIELRIKQFKLAADPTSSIKISRKFIEGKIRNSRTMLRRNGKNVKKTTLDKLSELSKKVSEVKEESELLGLEGLAGRIYFSNFNEMLKGNENKIYFDFKERNRRPPRDPINAVLSYLYALLAKDLTLSALMVGFDPYLGLFHKPKYGKPALALDLMEEFRPIICDSVAISIINSNEIATEDFIQRGGAVSLNSKGKKKVINAYERRLDDLIIHPFFKYSLSYRRVFEVQTRLLSRFINGEIKQYPIFITR